MDVTNFSSKGTVLGIIAVALGMGYVLWNGVGSFVTAGEDDFKNAKIENKSIQCKRLVGNSIFVADQYTIENNVIFVKGLVKNTKFTLDKCQVL